MGYIFGVVIRLFKRDCDGDGGQQLCIVLYLYLINVISKYRTVEIFIFGGCFDKCINCLCVQLAKYKTYDSIVRHITQCAGVIKCSLEMVNMQNVGILLVDEQIAKHKEILNKNLSIFIT